MGIMVYSLLYIYPALLWELWYIPYYGLCRICIINRSSSGQAAGADSTESYAGPGPLLQGERSYLRLGFRGLGFRGLEFRVKGFRV